MIPKQLRKDEFGFVKIPPKEKGPKTTGWQLSPYNWRQAEVWLSQGFNYGVMGGYGGLVIIDADKIEIEEINRKQLTETFKVKSGRLSGNGYYYYYLCTEIQATLKLFNEKRPVELSEDKKTERKYEYGQITSFGAQAVGAGSTHPSGRKYEVTADLPIATITKEQIFSSLADYLPKENEIFKKENYEDRMEWRPVSELRILDILKTFGVPTEYRGSQLQTSHPVHGSESGLNFTVNPDKNAWYCFRHRTGGGAMNLIAVLEGIMDCSEAVAGGLRGGRFLKTQLVASEKYGLKEMEKTNKEEKTTFQPISHSDLIKIKFPPLQWLVDSLIPSEAITIISGNPETYKSWLVTDLILKSVSKELLFGQFQTQSHGCLVIDEENGLRLLQERIKSLTENTNLPIYYLAYSGLKINQESIDRILSFCQKKALKTVVFDSFVRFLDGTDENSSTEIAKIFSLLKILVQNNITVILIHHHRKEGIMKSSNGQEMRGSSDILASVNCHIIVEKKEKKIVIIPNKLREAKKINPFILRIEEKEDKSISFVFDQVYEESELSEAIQKKIIELVAEKPNLSIDQICSILADFGGLNKIKTNIRYLETVDSVSSNRKGQGRKKV